MKPRNFPARKLARQLRADRRNQHPLGTDARELVKGLRADGVRGTQAPANPTTLEASRGIRTKKHRGVVRKLVKA